jgi:peptidoglycan/LPS O-acetylase OafA/YrhL
MRTLAVGLVLLDHVLEMIGYKYQLSFHPYDWCAGRIGVLLFFVHTSLVLNFSMARLRLGGWQLVRTFLVRRAFRLYPLSILCVLIVFAFAVPTMPWRHDFSWNWGSLLSNLALTTNLTFTQPVLGPLWSLPMEAQMYVALPLLFLLLGASRNPWIAAAMWVAAVVAACVQPHISDRLNVAGFGPCFVAGVLSYTLSGRYQKRLPAGFWLPFLLAVTASYALLQNVVGGVYNPPLQWIFCLIIGLSIPAFQDSTSRLANLAAHAGAKYSYGIYLFHCISLWLGCIVLADTSPAVQWMVAISSAIAASVVCYHVLEKPAIDLGARLTRAR